MTNKEVEFEQFHETWHRTAFQVVEAEEDADQATLRACWKKKQLSTHPDKGGDAQENKALNDAWHILREPDIRQQYLEFIREPKNRPRDPSNNAAGSSQQAGGDRDDGPDYSDWEFEGLNDEQKVELAAQIPGMMRRAQKSCFGCWFHGVPIVDSMWALGFLLYFASSDILQAVAALVVMSLVPITMDIWCAGVGGELLLLLCIGYCIFHNHVLRNCTYWQPNYVLSARLFYWSLRAAFGAVLALANLYRWSSAVSIDDYVDDYDYHYDRYDGSSTSSATTSSSATNDGLEQYNLTFFYIFGFRFFMPLVQLIAHCHSPASKVVDDNDEMPDQRAVFLIETRTSLMLYYDAWLNSFIVCTCIGVVGLYAACAFLIQLFIGIMCCVLSVFCRGDEDRDGSTDAIALCGLCYACHYLGSMVACTSWAAYAFANDRLQEARKHWDADFGFAADLAYGVWMLDRYKREVLRWKERAAFKQASKQAAEQAARQAAEQASGSGEKPRGAEEEEDQADAEGQPEPRGPPDDNQADAEGQPEPRGPPDDKRETSILQLAVLEGQTHVEAPGVVLT